MSELKAKHVVDVYDEYSANPTNEAQVYLKSEADKVIEDIVEGASSMFREFSRCRGLDTKSPLGRIANVAFKHWIGVERTLSDNRQLRLDKANLLRSNGDLHTQLKSERTGRLTDKIQYALNIRRQKYKRCLAMAKWCEQEERCLAIAPFLATGKECWEYHSDYWVKWCRRWLELAENLSKPTSIFARCADEN